MGAPDGRRQRRQVPRGGRGDGPLDLLLHGFPQFWWAWRYQIPALADAGYRAAAMDLRGFGASDKPPRGYDPRTLAEDAAGVIRSLGERDAVVVGQGLGGLVAWTLSVVHPRQVRRLVAVSMPHPRRLRRAHLTDARQVRASRHVLGYQRPVLPERGLVADDGQQVADMLQAWSGPGSPDADTEARYRQAALILVSRTAPGVLPVGGPVAAAARRPALRPPDGRPGHGADAAGPRRPRPVHPPDQRARLRPLRRGALPVAGDAGVGHFPRRRARRGPRQCCSAGWTTRRRSTVRRARQTPASRVRDEAGRARNDRPRDGLGRPLPRGAAGVERVPDDLVLPPLEALAEAQRLLDAGRPFHAHEVLEGAWKAAPPAERDLWQGLAQLAVGLTHRARRNASGASTLLGRGAARIAPYGADPPSGVDVTGLVAAAEALAAEPLVADEPPRTLRLRR